MTNPNSGDSPKDTNIKKPEPLGRDPSHQPHHHDDRNPTTEGNNQISSAIHALLAALESKQPNKKGTPVSPAETTNTTLLRRQRQACRCCCSSYTGPPTDDEVSNTKRETSRPRYDSARTISYQLQQRPTEKTSSLPGWDEVFHPPRAVRLDVTRPDLSSAKNAGMVNVLSWAVPQAAELNGAYLQYDECGYDGDGYVCRLRRGGGNLTVAGAGVVGVAGAISATGGGASRLGDRSLPLGKSERVIEEYMLTQPTTPTTKGQEREWEIPVGQRFGREWRFGLNGLSDWRLFSIVAAQLCRDADLDKTGGPNLLGEARRRLTKCFLSQFRDAWEPGRNLWGRSDHRWSGSADFNRASWEDLVFQYHMRVFTTPPHPHFWTGSRGGGLERVSGTLKDERNKRSLEIFEARYSVGLKTTWGLDFPVFSLVTMADTSAGDLLECANLGERSEWEKAGIHPSVQATGVAAFAFRIQSLLPLWEAQWSHLIDEIGKLLNADLSNMLDPTHRRKMMVDTIDLQSSEFYFAVIQILRIATDWIQESMGDLDQTVDDMERLYLAARTEDKFASFLPQESDAREATARVFKRNWESVILQQRQLGEALLVRVAKKVEETKSLRDGLFNATSVSEARKSTQLNHYILVFTVATVFYLPLSFIAAVFALGSFDWHDAGQRTWFIATVILVAGITYLVSWLSIWIVGDPARKRSFADAYARLDRKVLFDWAERRLPGG